MLHQGRYVLRQTEPAAGLLAGLLTLLVAAVAIGCGDGCAYPHSRLDPVPRVMGHQFDTAVRVEMLCLDHDPFLDMIAPQIGAGVGSGVIVDARHVLTAHHVIDCPYMPDVHVVLADGRRLRVAVEKEWRDSDVARLVIASGDTFGNIPPPPTSSPGIGAGVCAAPSFPKHEGICGQVEHVTENTCSAGAKRWCHDIELVMEVHGGNSGSPIYDAGGSLVGLVTGVGLDPDTRQETITAYGHTLPKDVMP